MNRDELMKYYVVEWSQKDAAFHITDVADMLDINLRRYMSAENNDYQVVALVPTHEAAKKVTKELRCQAAKKKMAIALHKNLKSCMNDTAD